MRPLKQPSGEALCFAVRQSIFPHPDPLFENQLFALKKAAKYLGISPSYLRKLKRKKIIPFVRIGKRGIRFRVASLNAWIAERESEI